jgi:hypothetical protein
VPADRFVTLDTAGDTTMVILGIDAHKRTHTLVAVDMLGRRLGTTTTASTTTVDHLG